MRPGAVVQGVIVTLLVHEVSLGQTSGSVQRPGSPWSVIGQRTVVVCLIIVVLIHVATVRVAGAISGIPVIVAISVVGVVVSILSAISVIVIVIMAAVVLTP